MSHSDAGVFVVERVSHIITPMIVKMTPAIGSSGMTGQRMINMRLAMPPIMMMNVPTRSKINREINPTQREIKRSMNIRNLTSSEVVPEAISAEI